MTGNELAPFKRARLDQWNAFLDEVVRHTVIHLTAAHCEVPAGVCVGGATRDILDRLTPVETEMLLEVAVVRLAGPGFIYEPSFHCFTPNRPDADPDDDDHDFSITCDWGWMCNGDGCTVRTDDTPCPEHAPTDIPQLRLTECMSVPLHWIWVHRNDDNGHGCPACDVDRLLTEIRPLRDAQQLRVHRWCWLTNRVKGALVWLRLMRVRSWSSDCRYRMSHVSARWRWTRR